MTRGEVAGATARDRAVHLAGALAELGVTRLRLHRPGAAAEALNVRRTDLPGLIVAAPDGSVLVCDSPALRVAVGPDRLQWQSDDPTLIQALSRGG